MDTNAFLSTGHIALWILLAGLFLPRLTLFLAMLMNQYPVNALPDLLNFVFWLIFPRFLMAFYIYTDIGVNNIWFWAYIATGIAGMFGEGGLRPAPDRPPNHRQPRWAHHDYRGGRRSVARQLASVPAELAWFCPGNGLGFRGEDQTGAITQRKSPIPTGVERGSPRAFLRKRESGLRLSTRDRRIARELLEDEGREQSPH